MQKQATIHVTGIVQGVGFRPFIYRIAKSLSLDGYVKNLGDAGVEIIVEGEEESIQNLIWNIKHDSPSISRIDSLDVQWSNSQKVFREFEIRKSSTERNKDAIPVLPPDIAICDDCIRDLDDPTSHWYLYPFTSCAACGPRFSTVTDLPYDRPNTTMIDFPLCNICNTGYTNPFDRRYHAQTTACETCGPIYRLLDKDSETVSDRNPIEMTANLIDRDKIVALQGISGTHIATKTSDHRVIHRLRLRKGRPTQPFAIMVRDLKTLKGIVNINEVEERILTSWRRPIVLAKKNFENNVLQILQHDVLDAIAPNLDSIGVMLPYAPMHHLLFKYTKEPALVMTSANPTGVPMYIDSSKIMSELSDIVDYFLVHNRRIHQRADDSVVKLLDDTSPVFIRRARGYVPEPLHFGGPWRSLRIIGVGPEEKTTGAVLKSGRIYMTQYIGDTDQSENIDFLSDAIEHMLHLLDVNKLDAVACDLHPEFLSTELAQRLSNSNNVPLFRIQHHHAHLAAVMVDGVIPCDSRIVCITADGYGYGTDGTAWGGEILVGNCEESERRGGLVSQVYTGGDLSAVYAARSLIGIVGEEIDSKKLLDMLGSSQVGPNTPISEQVLETLLKSERQRINTISSTSAGRFLDAIALALDICSENSYDGECPIKLEAVAHPSDIRIEPRFVEADYGPVLDTTNSLLEILDLKNKGVSRKELAYIAQWHLGESLAKLACDVAEEEGVLHIGFSGGVALNRIITSAIGKQVKRSGLVPIFHSIIPPGDGGVSAGQVASSAALFVNQWS
ncbi:MAG: carbamoyltransferase HypF [Candidatus Thorarchaeota archaeon]|nr:carbamoyltransferase HypF [Candidatus Thorarchaeota archaeon]